MPPRPRLSLRRKLLFALFVLAALAALSELGWRTYLMATGRGFFDDPRTFTSPFFTTYEEPMPQRSGGRLRYRNTSVAVDKPEDEVRVLCLGGSTTVNMRAGVSFAQLLDERFAAARGDRRVRVLNAGGEGFSSAHSLVNLALRNLDAAPDVVLVYHNINDLSACWFGDGVTSDYSEKYRTDFYLGMRHRAGVVAGIASVSRLARYAFGRVAAIAFPAYEQRTDRPHEQGLVYFTRNLRSVVAVARAHGAQVVLASQAARSDLRGAAGFAAYNAATRAVAAELGVRFVDAAGAMDADELFLDDAVHYTRAGVTRLSEALYPHLAAAVGEVEAARRK